VPTSKGPEVVILGKGKKADHKETHDLIKEIQPSSVPAELLDSVFITLVDESRYKVDSQYLDQGIDYTRIEEQMKKLGLKGDIALIEVVVDLDAVKQELTSVSHAVLDSLFDED